MCIGLSIIRWVLFSDMGVIISEGAIESSECGVNLFEHVFFNRMVFFVFFLFEHGLAAAFGGTVVITVSVVVVSVGISVGIGIGVGGFFGLDFHFESWPNEFIFSAGMGLEHRKD